MLAINSIPHQSCLSLQNKIKQAYLNKLRLNQKKYVINFNLKDTLTYCNLICPACQTLIK